MLTRTTLSASGRAKKQIPISHIKTRIGLLLLLALNASGAEMRTWTFQQNSNTMQGAVVNVVGDSVALKRPDGAVFSVKTAYLIESDRIYLEGLAKVQTEQQAATESQITGAFGVTLGQVYGASARWVTEGPYYTYCNFTPSPGLPGFTEYRAIVNPRSKVVHTIIAVETFSGNMLDRVDQSVAETLKIVAALEKKYGKAAYGKAPDLLPSPSSEYEPESFTITRGQRFVRVYNSARFIIVKYVDTALETAAKNDSTPAVPGL
jgi:hypothetical protein